MGFLIHFFRDFLAFASLSSVRSTIRLQAAFYNNGDPISAVKQQNQLQNKQVATCSL